MGFVAGRGGLFLLYQIPFVGLARMDSLLLHKCLALQMLILEAGELQIRQNWVLIFKKTGGFPNLLVLLKKSHSLKQGMIIIKAKEIKINAKQ